MKQVHSQICIVLKCIQWLLHTNIEYWFDHSRMVQWCHNLRSTMKHSTCLLIIICFPEVARNLDFSAYKKLEDLTVRPQLRSAGAAGILTEYQISILQSRNLFCPQQLFSVEQLNVLSCTRQGSGSSLVHYYLTPQ